MTGGCARATGGGTGSWGAIWCTYRCSNSALMPRIWIFPACRHAILQLLHLPLLSLILRRRFMGVTFLRLGDKNVTSAGPPNLQVRFGSLLNLRSGRKGHYGERR